MKNTKIKIRPIKLDDKTWKDARLKRIEEGLSWNEFMKLLLEKLWDGGSWK